MKHQALLFLAIIPICLFLVTIATPAYAAESANEILTKVNQYRASYGLAAVRTDPLTCNFAATRAKEISDEFTHNGFYDRAKSKSMPYHHYKLVTENLARTPNHNAVEMWIKSPKHAANMRKDTPLVCVESYGDYYAYEGLAI